MAIIQFEKLPKDFFYNNCKIYNQLGKGKGLKIYLLLLKLKNNNNEIYTTKNIIATMADLGKNTTRNNIVINNTLLELHKLNYIGIDIESSSNAKGNDLLAIIWKVNVIDSSWMPFYTRDFDLITDFNEEELSVFLLIRAYKNNKSNTTYLTIEQISDILKIGKQTAIKIIDKLKNIGVIVVFSSNGKLKSNGGYTRVRNQYKYVYRGD